MFVWNVGYLMINDVMLFDGDEVFEGIMDGLIILFIVKYDLFGNSVFKNSCEGSIYIVKFKMYGLEEVVFFDVLFEVIEFIIDVFKNILKMGIMDEECCISVNF